MIKEFNEVESFLYSLKLDPYEAKTYLTLVTHGPQNYKELKTLSDVPYEKISHILKTLHSKGWIKTRKESPEVFYAIYPEKPLIEYLTDTKRWIIWE